MNELVGGAHLHLLVNHAPVLGAFFALALLVASFIWAPDVLRRTAFVVLIGTGIAGAASDMSGDPAEDAIRGMPGVRRELIHAHESLADKAYLVAGIVAVLSIVALVRWRRVPVPASVAGLSLAASLIVTGLMSYTALLGGRIRHTEVRPGATPADAVMIEPPRAPRPPGG